MPSKIKLLWNRARRGFINFLHAHPRAAATIEGSRFCHAVGNMLLINSAVDATTPRPQAYTLWTPTPIDPNPAAIRTPEPPVRYVSWPGLTDRRFTSRHLPPAPTSYHDRLPRLEDVVALYKRERFIPAANCSALLCFFAQWFTDSFLRKDQKDERLNTSNHEIDLCEIYGLDAETARILRTRQGGKLKTSGGGRFPARLCDASGDVKDEFKGLIYVQPYLQGKSLEEITLGSLVGPILDSDLHKDEKLELLRKRKLGLYATGLERGNSTILYTAISSIFIREHNRLCDMLAAAHPDWHDDRLFETARNINIVMALNLTIYEYINALSRPPIKLYVDRHFAEKKRWYRTNRIAIEFNLLYRWHSFVPDTLEVEGDTLTHIDYRFNNEVLEKYGAAAVIAAASRQPGGQIGLKNNPDFLLQAEAAAHMFARNQRLRSFVEYQAAFGQKPVGSFEELTDDVELREELRTLYNDEIRDVEFLVGLFAQKRDLPDVILPLLMRTMVAVDAFSQILTNPLLSKNVYGPDAFSEEGMKVIDETTSFHQLVDRNRRYRDEHGACVDEDYPNPASFTYTPPAVAVH
jgi:prostaglandin-endoperoxide synthase 2